jgi:hypothetical protein
LPMRITTTGLACCFRSGSGDGDGTDGTRCTKGFDNNDT